MQQYLNFKIYFTHDNFQKAVEDIENATILFFVLA